MVGELSQGSAPEQRSWLLRAVAPSCTLCLGSAGASLLPPRCQPVSADSGRPAAIVTGRSVCETAGVASVSVALRRVSSAGQRSGCSTAAPPCTATASAPQLPPRGHPVLAYSERLAATMMGCLTCETTSVPSVNVGAPSTTAAAAAPTQPPPLDLVALATPHPPCSSPRPSPAPRAFLALVSYS